jgi:carbon-monoxide dehydrogenase medium subunit
LSIEFLKPGSFAEASALLSHHGEDARLIAGGVSVALMLRQRLIAPPVLVSLGRIPGGSSLRLEPDGLHIGPLTSLRDLERSEIVRSFCPALAHAFHVVGNVRVRTQATLGGNLCAADYAADPPAMLTALESRVKVLGPDGEREIPLEEFFLGFYTTALHPDEVLTEIVIPTIPASGRASYQKFTSLSAEGRPCVAVAAVADFEPDEKCRQLSIAVGAAVETPQRVAAAEALARGQVLTDDLLAAVAEEYARSLDQLSDSRGSAWYRREMIRVFVRRALEEIRDGSR